MGLTSFHITARQGSERCGRLDREIRRADPRLYSAYNTRTRRYEIWRDCPEGRQALIQVVETPGGRYADPDACVVRIHRELHAGDLSRPGNSPRELVERLNAGNEQAQRGEWERDKSEMLAVSEYVRPWIAQAEEGQPRYPASDVIAGLEEAMGEQ